MYASAQALDCLARTKDPSFPNRKLTVSHPVFSGGHPTLLLIFAAVPAGAVPFDPPRGHQQVMGIVNEIPGVD